MSGPVDTSFSEAHWQALGGDASAMAALLRDASRPLSPDEREYLACMVERLAELARGERGGDVGRPGIAAGHPAVTRVVDRYKALVDGGRQKSEAKALVASEEGVSVRTVEHYLRLAREREALVAKLTAERAKN